MTAIDMRQMSWGDSSRSGPWVKFALSDSETLEQLKMNDGKCFKVFLVPVDDNGNPLQGERAELLMVKDNHYVEQHKFPQEKEFQPLMDGDVAAIAGPAHDSLRGIEGAPKPEVFKINGRPASNWAAFQIANPHFQKFMGANSKEHCDQILKSTLNIGSKSEIDSNEKVFDSFKDLLFQFG